MASRTEASRDVELERLNAELLKQNLTPTWAYYTSLITPQPKVSYAPYLWKWEVLLHYLRRAGELVDLERGAERRSFELVNPALRHIMGTTHTIGAAVQLVKPGEVAPAHRHLANAIRFIVKGRGSYTAVQGEPLYMEERDLILTPSWTWHDHGNETTEPIIWVDALDYPFNQLMQVSFFNAYPEARHPFTKPLGYTANWMGFARPTWETYAEPVPLATYRWTETARALQYLQGSEGSPFDGILLEYVNPFRQGPVLPTMACYAQLLRPGEHTRAHRHTSSAICFVLDGAGYSVLNGERFNWAPGDLFMIPPWYWHEHVNTAAEESRFFVISDKPIYDTFNLSREEAYAENGHQQRVEKTFTPMLLSGA
ncbi:MAG: cupin domain-containing protein [Candidatus Tectomicrobia bacterium]|nr:cupin domain-containing protein [Candidatus Tectomicrobia bacterium]